jgi:hypothetical protein
MLDSELNMKEGHFYLISYIDKNMWPYDDLNVVFSNNL